MGYDAHNIFARILRGEIPVKPIFENDVAIAIPDIAPAAPVHVLVIPKGQYTSFDDFAQRAGSARMAEFFAAVRAVALQVGVVESGYRLIMNHGADASQTVPHFHVHILGGRQLGGLVPSDALHR